MVLSKNSKPEWICCFSFSFVKLIQNCSKLHNVAVSCACM
jgi:hypothetical protein